MSIPIDKVAVKARELPREFDSLMDLVDWELKRRAILGEAERTAITLWIAHTYVYERFKHTPRLLLTSGDPGVGKSNILKLIEAMSYGGKKLESGSTVAAVRDFRSSGKVKGTTLCLDQLDAVAKTNPEDARLLNMFCSSAEVGAKIAHKVKITARGDRRTKIASAETWENVEVDIGYPVALGKIGELPGDAIMSRCIVIRMQPETLTERAAQMDARRDTVPGGFIRAFMPIELAGLTNEYIEAPPGLTGPLRGRTEDIWQPLLNVARHVGWEDRALAAMAELNDHEHKLSRAAALLKHIWDKVRPLHDKRITGPELDRLVHLDAYDGGTWSPEMRGRALNGLGVKTRRTGQKGRFYLRADIEEAAQRHRVGDSSDAGDGILETTGVRFSGG